MMWRIYPALFFASGCLLNGQQNPLAPLNAGQRDLANGNYVTARQQIDQAVEIVRNVTFDPAETRRIVLAGAEVDALMADFEAARNLAHALQGMGDLTPEQQLRLQIVLARCAIGQDDLAAAATAASAAVSFSVRANLNGDGSINASAELAEVLRLEGKFDEARRYSSEVVRASEGRLGSPNLSSTALIAPAEVAVSSGQLSDARRLAEKALDARGSDPLTALLLRELLARIAIEEGRLPDAAILLGGLTATAKSRLGSAHPFVAECLLTEAAYSGQRGSWADARAKLENASILIPSRPANRIPRLRLLLYSSSAALALNRIDDAAGYLAQAKPLANNRPELAGVLNAQAAVAIERQRYEDAEKDLRDADAMLSSLAEERQPVRMKIRFNFGLLYDRWGDPERADGSLARWIDLRPAGAGDEPEAIALSITGHNAFHRKQYEQAVKLLSLSVVIRGSLGENSGTEMSAEYELLGNSLRQSAKLEEAVGAFQNALDLRRRAEPAVADLELYRSLAETLESLRRISEALPYFDTWLRLTNRAGPEDSEGALRLADRVSQLHFREGQFGAAEPLLRQLYDAGQSGRGPAARDRSDILERLGETEERLNHYGRAADFFDELARIDLLKKKIQDAQQFAVRARDAAQKSSGTPDLASALNVLADVTLAQVKPGDARGLDDAKALYVQAGADAGADSRTKAVSLNGQGGVALTNKDWGTADQLLDRALNALNEDPNPNKGLEALIDANRALAQSLTGHSDEANALYSRFFDLEPLSKPPQDPPLLDQLNELARFYALQPGHAQDVLKVYNRLVDSSRRFFGEQSDEYAYALYNVAESYSNNKRYDDAVPLYEKSSRLYEQSYGIQSDQVRTVRGPMADAYVAGGRIREAIQLIEPLLSSPPDMSDKTQTALLDQMAGLYRKVADPGKAIGIYQSLVDASVKQQPLSQNSMWLSATKNLIAANIEKGDDKTASTRLKTARESIHRSAGNKDTLSEVDLLRAYASALRKRSRDKNDKNLADTTDETATKMEKRLLGS